MRRQLYILGLATLAALTTSCCHPYGRCVRPAYDITPGNNPCTLMDWRYGAADIEVQTTKVSGQLMDRWFAKTGFDWQSCGRPRIIITEIDNRTDHYIATDMMRDVIEGVAANDGRFTVTVGDSQDTRELDYLLQRTTQDPKFSNSSRPQRGQVTAPQFLGKLRLTKAVTSDGRFDYEDYRLTITLYDIETQEIVDSSWDLLRKQVKRW